MVYDCYVFPSLWCFRGGVIQHGSLKAIISIGEETVMVVGHHLTIAGGEVVVVVVRTTIRILAGGDLPGQAPR